MQEKKPFKPSAPPLHPEELVTVCRPGGERDVTLPTPAGPIRFFEGKAHDVPLSVARGLLAPGWSIERPDETLDASPGEAGGE